MLRSSVKQLWILYSDEFSSFWMAEENEESRAAMLLAVLEDLPSTLFGALMEVTCPELLDLERLMEISERGAQGKGSHLIDIMRKVYNEEENSGHSFDTKAMERGVATTELKHESLGIAEEGLLLARTCALLQFCNGLLLIWTNIQSGEGMDFGGGIDEFDDDDDEEN